MKRIAPLPSSLLFYTSYRNVPSPCPPALLQCLHTTPPRVATPLPITATGPPPAAPQPAASQYGERVDRRRRQAELLKRGQDMRASHMKPGTAIKKRFWKDVSVQTDDGMTHPSELNCTYASFITFTESTLLIRLILYRRKLYRQPRHSHSSQSHNKTAPYYSPFKAISCNCAGSRMGSPCLCPAGYPLPPHSTDLD